MEEGDILIFTEQTWERTFIETQNAFIKSERPDPDIPPWWAKERLQNEFATLQYIAVNTTIPVPPCQLIEKDGLLSLRTVRMSGIMLASLNDEARLEAIKVVDHQMTTDIIPQLHMLRRSYIGSVDPKLPVFPPLRLYGCDRRSWERKSSLTGEDEFVLCHNDLSPFNILIDPKTYKITAILDWEYAGFFPSTFEIPFWTAVRRGEYGDMSRGTKKDGLAFWGLKPSDMRHDVDVKDNSCDQVRNEELPLPSEGTEHAISVL